MRNFADVLMDAVDAKQSRLVVGLDPRLEYIPNDLREPALREAGSTSGAAADMIVSFNKIVIDIVAPYVPAVKVQVAFYEIFGPAGHRAYEDTLKYAAEKKLVVIGDVKRSDISSTADAYARAHLGTTELGEHVVHHGTAHAITVVPYFGWEGVEPFLNTAADTTKGIFLMVRSSNPTAHEIQGKQDDPDPMYVRVAKKADEWGRKHIGDRGYSAVGAVVGATYPEDIPALRELMPRSIFLLPGYGAQGATAADVAAAFDDNGHGAVIAASRKIILAHRTPDNQMWEHAIEEAVKEANADMAANLPPLKCGG
jgi:orotidine-5'-phosphate decarboxylase